MKRPKHAPIRAKLWYIPTMYYNVLYGGGGKKLSVFIHSINICVCTLFHKQESDVVNEKRPLCFHQVYCWQKTQIINN